MDIKKECYDCGAGFAISEFELEDGYMRRDGDVVWLCPSCRDNDTEEVDP